MSLGPRTWAAIESALNSRSCCRGPQHTGPCVESQQIDSYGGCQCDQCQPCRECQPCGDGNLGYDYLGPQASKTLPPDEVDEVAGSAKDQFQRRKDWYARHDPNGPILRPKKEPAKKDRYLEVLINEGPIVAAQLAHAQEEEKVMNQNKASVARERARQQYAPRPSYQVPTWCSRC